MRCCRVACLFSCKTLLNVLSTAIVLVICNCSWSLSDIKSRHHKSDDVNVTYQQMRLRMRSLVDPMSGQIETAADRILAKYDQPQIKRGALELKSQGVPALRESLFQPVPMTALTDTWVLLFQMEDYYRSGNGARMMGPAAPEVVKSIQVMQADYQEVIKQLTISGDISSGLAFVSDWAHKHPIQGSIAYRESTLTRSAEVDWPDEFTATNAVADITLTIDDLNRRLEIYSDQVVRQARWEAQLLTMELSEHLELGQAMPLAADAITHVGDISESFDQVSASVDKLVPIVDRLTKVAESSPLIIASERAAAITAAQNEISRAIKAVENERSITLKHITRERLAALETLQQTISNERRILTAEVEALSTKVVDHAFKRVTQLFIGIGVAIVAILLVGLFLVRRMISGFIVMKADQS